MVNFHHFITNSDYSRSISQIINQSFWYYLRVSMFEILVKTSHGDNLKIKLLKRTFS